MANKHDPEFRNTSIGGFCNRNGICCAQGYIEIRAGRLKAKKMGKRTIITEQAERDWLDALPDAVVNEQGRLVAAI